MEWIIGIVAVLIFFYLLWLWIDSPRSGNKLLDSKLREFKKLKKQQHKQAKKWHKRIKDYENKGILWPEDDD